MNRRVALAALSAAPVLAAPRLRAPRIEQLDKAVDSYIGQQLLDRSHKHYGSVVSGDGLYYGATPGNLLSTFLAAWIQPGSRHYKSARVAERMELAAGAFARIQTQDGNWNLPTTNYNSAPDTAFIMQTAVVDIANARQFGFPEFERMLLPAIERAGHGLVTGGMHTPNHRWVAAASLAGLYKLYGDPKYLRRAEQWLDEGIDMDSDGQYAERSPVVYNGICNRSLVLAAEFLGRPEYLDYVQRNLTAMLYLRHADGELVTEISRRQDLNSRGTHYNHWLALAYLAWKRRNGVFAHLAREVEEPYGITNQMQKWPELVEDLPAAVAPPGNYERIFPVLGAARIRRGPVSMTVLRDRDRFFTYRRGAAVIHAVRFASAFFGRGQFTSKTFSKSGNTYELRQELEAGYYQPFTPARKLTGEEFDATREQRTKTQVCKLISAAQVTETAKGATLRIRVDGTGEVPVTVEINLRENTAVEGAEPVIGFKDAWLLKRGYAIVRAGQDGLRIGPGRGEHVYLDVRGARPRLEGPSLFLTGLTPFDHSIEITAI